MCAHYVTWHKQQGLARVLFKATTRRRQSCPAQPVAQARRSAAAALAKATAKVIADGGPMHSFPTLLADLTTIAANRIQPAAG